MNMSSRPLMKTKKKSNIKKRKTWIIIIMCVFFFSNRTRKKNSNVYIIQGWISTTESHRGNLHITRNACYRETLFVSCFRAVMSGVYELWSAANDVKVLCGATGIRLSRDWFFRNSLSFWPISHARTVFIGKTRSVTITRSTVVESYYEIRPEKQSSNPAAAPPRFANARLSGSRART